MDIKNKLEKKYVAFLDVLGFKEMVYADDADRLETYFKTIRKTLDNLQQTNVNIASLQISDSTILIAPDTKEDFVILVLAVQTIQSELALIDIWIRGGISYGDVYYDKNSNLIVGKGLIGAYLLEQEAKYPRVIIDPSIILHIAENSQDFLEKINNKYMKEKRTMSKLIHTWPTFILNDASFISYGHQIVLDKIWEGKLDRIHNLILKNLYSSQRNYDKYLWVKHYFMDVLRDIKEQMYYVYGDNNNEAIAYYKKWFEKFSEL